MKKLIQNADMWKAAEDTGLMPSDYHRDKSIPSECPDELIEEQGAGAGDTRKPEEGAKGTLEGG